ncbi:4288_t:CDS:2 [Dentiscutata heterogama]|uniref:4288_t:CDS:1 n=1 Tax=Dentiscutata heterogama TaxID=1316150 RepID=A0ACA9NHS0_9GLOM|nr:4288_t:CDS:2 [Dentiscutata heterogama]
MSSSNEHSKCKPKKVQCHCPKCKGKFVDQRTQQEHISLADIDKEEPLPVFQLKIEGSGTEYSNNNSYENDESNDSENEEDSTTSDEDEEDSTISEEDKEDSSDMEDNIIRKFKDISPAEEDNMNLDQSLEISQLYNVYQKSDDNESMIIEDEMPDEPNNLPSSSDSLNDLSDSSKSSIDSQEHKSINFIPPEIDPEVFVPPFNFEDNSNDWIIL